MDPSVRARSSLTSSLKSCLRGRASRVEQSSERGSSTREDQDFYRVFLKWIVAWAKCIKRTKLFLLWRHSVLFCAAVIG